MTILAIDDNDRIRRRAGHFLRAGLILFIISAGCQRISVDDGVHAANHAELEAFLNQKIESNESLVKILQSITDAATMKQAWNRLIVQHKLEEKLRQRAVTMGKPSAESLAKVGHYRERLQASIEQQKKELKRIQSLPDGEAFVQQLEVLSAQRLLPPARVGD